MTDASKDITSISEEGTTNNTCHSLACEDRPTLGSSFGGVVFKQSTSPRSRKRCEHSENIFIHDEINEASQQHRENAKCPECFRDVVCSAHCDEAYNSNVNTADVDRLYSCTVSDYIHTEQGIHMSCSHEGNYTEVTNAVCYHKNPPNSCFSGPQVERSASFSCDERPNGELEVRDCDHSTQEGIFKLGNETKHAASNKGEEHCLKGCAMCDQEQMMESHAGRGSYGSRVTSGRTSLNSSPSCVSDNVFYNRSAYQNSASLTDIASASSVSSCQSGSRDTKTSRMRFELRHGRHHHGSDMIEYITPLQRREKQIKDLLHERAQMIRERAEKDAEILSLKSGLNETKTQMDADKNLEIAELKEKIRILEKERFEEIEELCMAQEELAKIDSEYTELKRKMSEKEIEFEDYLLNMYHKGQKAAVFEREEELEMLACSPESRVSMREITRKLSRTELELAKWQRLKLEESYSRSELPRTEAEVTLNFLKDSFFHFITGAPAESVDHLRAMINIFEYSDDQMAKIRKRLREFKHLDKKQLLLI